MTSAFTKVIHPGAVSVGTIRPAEVFCKIEFDGERLSITGVEGPLPSGNARGSCGQIEMGYKHRNPADDDARYSQPAQLKRFANGWNEERWLDFLDVWHRWHNNSLCAGCEHQTAEGWAERPIDPSKPLQAYGKHFEGQRSDSWNMLAWIRPEEHPEGLLTKPCPTCGYRYGTEWRTEEIPGDVLYFLRALPDSKKSPAWV